MENDLIGCSGARNIQINGQHIKPVAVESVVFNF